MTTDLYLYLGWRIIFLFFFSSLAYFMFTQFRFNLTVKKFISFVNQRLKNFKLLNEI